MRTNTLTRFGAIAKAEYASFNQVYDKTFVITAWAISLLAILLALILLIRVLATRKQKLRSSTPPFNQFSVPVRDLLLRLLTPKYGTGRGITDGGNVSDLVVRIGVTVRNGS